MEYKQSIEALNMLIEINNDRIAGYETASKETDAPDLKLLFTQLLQTSVKCNQELGTEVTKLGGTIIDGTKNTGKIYRVWMEFKAAVTGNDRKAILNSCEYGEDVAKDTYESVLENDSEDLSAGQLSLIEAQYALLKADHDKVKMMRDSLSGKRVV